MVEHKLLHTLCALSYRAPDTAAILASGSQLHHESVSHAASSEHFAKTGIPGIYAGLLDASGTACREKEGNQQRISMDLNHLAIGMKHSDLLCHEAPALLDTL